MIKSKNLKTSTRKHRRMISSPIGGKFFLYVNHSREVTSDKISSFSALRAEINTTSALMDGVFTKLIFIHYNMVFKSPPVSALYSFPKIHTGSEVSGKSSNSPNRSVSYVNVAAKQQHREVQDLLIIINIIIVVLSNGQHNCWGWNSWSYLSEIRWEFPLAARKKTIQFQSEHLYSVIFKIIHLYLFFFPWNGLHFTCKQSKCLNIVSNVIKEK